MNYDDRASKLSCAEFYAYLISARGSAFKCGSRPCVLDDVSAPRFLTQNKATVEIEDGYRVANDETSIVSLRRSAKHLMRC